MEFPLKLETLDNSQRESWNDDIEEYLGKPQAPSQTSALIEFDYDALQSTLGKVAAELEIELKAAVRSSDTDEQDPNIEIVVRTSKNVLRWYIQIYLEHRQVQRRKHRSQNVCNVDILRSPGTLDTVMSILNWVVERNRNLRLARDASLFVFYATYRHFPGDKCASDGIDHLINHQAFPRRCLEMLITVDSIPLALTLVRNLHSMAVSSPGAQTTILDAKLHFDPSKNKKEVPWAPQKHTTICFSEVCLSLVRWSLDVDTPYQTESREDRRLELVVEILNSFYAMRKGQEIMVAQSSENCSDENDSSLKNLIVRILTLSSTKGSHNQSCDEVISKRINECKLSAISLLMDSDASFGKYLVKNETFGNLLEIFKRQVDDTVDNAKLDSTATAALVPILVVLNRYSMADSDVQRIVKEFVFPRETEKKIEKNMKEKRKTQMSPLDAPKDTLRGKLIVLLSWVDGYVKRCSAELMWTLCDSDYKQFTSRVGLGNALPLLNSKGLSPIPIPS